MAIPPDTVFEVQPGVGSDTLCSGGFSTANKGATGVDYSVQAAAQVTFTAELSGVGTTALTSSGAHFTNLMLGNLILITGQGSYCITAFTSTSIVTVDRALGTFSGATGYVGGAFATLGKAYEINPGGTGSVSPVVFLKATGTVNSCSGSSNVAGGRFTMPTASATQCGLLVGYTSNRTTMNTDAKPQVKPTANGITVCTTNAQNIVRNIDFENPNPQTGCIAISTGANLHVAIENCKFSGYQNSIITFGVEVIIVGCEFIISDEATSFAIGASADNAVIMGCDIHGGAGSGVVGINTGASCTIVRCNFYAITGTAGVALNMSTNAKNRVVECNFYNIKTDAILTSAGTGLLIADCNFEACGGYGINASGGVIDYNCFMNNSGFNNTLGNVNNGSVLSNQGFISLSASAFTAPGSGNFALNNTAGGGASVRAAGFPHVYPAGTTTSYADVGAAQTPAGASGATSFAY